MNKIKKIIDKKNKSKIVCLTAYSKNMAEELDKYVDIVLVGDSLGQVIKGEKTTHGVTIDEIAYHARCVRSGLKTSILMVDLPINSYNTKLKAYKNSDKFISTRLADLIKIEIDTNNLDVAKYLIKKNILNKTSELTSEDLKNINFQWHSPGIRAQLFDKSTKRLENDFVLINKKNTFHILNSISPAWTCSLINAKETISKISKKIKN